MLGRGGRKVVVVGSGPVEGKFAFLASGGATPPLRQ